MLLQWKPKTSLADCGIASFLVHGSDGRFQLFLFDHGYQRQSAV
jgi:hypothetical protein